MITIYQNAHLFSPDDRGRKDILVVNGTIEETADRINLTGVACKTIDLEGMITVPGFIDKHVHVTGGGGEFGFESFARPVEAEELLAAGTTTVVGLLGTDNVCKDLHDLYAKTKQLDKRISAWMLTGSYAYPSKTITGRVDADIALIDKVVGCKLALSDDRGSFPTDLELKRLLSEVWRGGMTGGKAGILHIHLGTLETRIGQIVDICRHNPRLLPHVSLTHCAREKSLFHECIAFAKSGGTLDITTGGSRFVEPHEALRLALESGTPLDRLSFSSDGHGGIRHIDPVTGVETYGTSSVESNLAAWRNVVREGILSIPDALRVVSTNPANELKLSKKGRLEPGSDADMVVFDDALEIRHVIAKGC